jgi:hypothetical protein
VKDVIHNTDVAEVAWTNGATIELDLAVAENFTITIIGGGTAPTVAGNTINMTNIALRDGQSGWISIKRSSYRLEADTYLAFGANVFELDVVTDVDDLNNKARYLYEVVDGRVLIYAQLGETTV